MQKLMKDLRDIAGTKHTALLVIDVQHDFCSSNGAMAQKGLDMSRVQASIPRLNNFIAACRMANILVVWVKEVISEDKLLPNFKAKWDLDDGIWFIKENTLGTELYKEIIRPLPNEPIITKYSTYDAFENTDLELLLRSKSIQTILMTGVAANVCVETTARHGFVKGYYVVAVSDCTDTFSKFEYDAAMHNIGTYFGKVTTSTDLISLWQSLKD